MLKPVKHKSQEAPGRGHQKTRSAWGREERAAGRGDKVVDTSMLREGSQRELGAEKAEPTSNQPLMEPLNAKKATKPTINQSMECPKVTAPGGNLGVALRPKQTSTGPGIIRSPLIMHTP